MNVEIKQCDPIRIVAVRHVGPYQEIGSAFEKVAGYGHKHQLFWPGLQIVGVFHDDPDNPPAHGLRADAGFSVQQDPAHLDDGFDMVDVAGGEYACAMHAGPYEGLSATYAAMMTSISASGRSMDDRPCCEIYLNSPQDTPPDELKTEVRIPVR